MKIHDTNIFIKYFRKMIVSVDSPFLFTNLNLCEWLEGKNIYEQEMEFEKIDDLIQTTNSSYIFSNRYKKEELIVNNFELNKRYRFRIALKVAKRTYLEFLNIYLQIIYLIPLIVYIHKNQIKLADGRVGIENHEFIYINKGLFFFWKKYVRRMINELKKAYSLKNENLEEYGAVILYNSIARVFTRKFDFKIHEVNGKFNYEKVFRANNVRIENDELSKIVNELFIFENNKKDSQDYYIMFYKILANPESSFEFQDICDFYSEFAAKGLEVCFNSDDNKHKRKMSSLYN